jgi:hypothetical protein
MYKITLVGLSVGMFLAALAPANAVDRPTQYYSGYEGQSVYAPFSPVYEGRSGFTPAAPVATVPYGQLGGCLAANNPQEAVKGIRHWYPVC